MTRAEVKSQFDQIASFSGVGRFIDTPLKHFSSGMQVRLGFAVAAHLNSEILIVDEVLAVGDAAFQKRCLGKMREVAACGRSVLFVSHDLARIRGLCGQAILLSDGIVRCAAAVSDVVREYQTDLNLNNHAMTRQQITRLPTDPIFELLDAAILQNSVRTCEVQNGDSIEVDVMYCVKEPVRGLRLWIDVSDMDGNLIFRSFHDADEECVPEHPAGVFRTRASIAAETLGPTQYELSLRAGIAHGRHCLPDTIRWILDVIHTSPQNRAYPHSRFYGRMLPNVDWTPAIAIEQDTILNE
jgi:lipopolysaccharide transport system ATP-binding protein